jgi:hypothetical protein
MHASSIRGAFSAEAAALLRRAAEFADNAKNLQVSTALTRHALSLLDVIEVASIHFPEKTEEEDAIETARVQLLHVVGRLATVEGTQGRPEDDPLSQIAAAFEAYHALLRARR